MFVNLIDLSTNKYNMIRKLRTVKRKTHLIIATPNYDNLHESVRNVFKKVIHLKQEYTKELNV